MNNLMQPLKLQIAASFKIYIANIIIMIASSLLVYFIGNASIENFAFILGFEIIFTLVMGVINYSVIGKTYYSLKHDRRLFTLSSLIINLLNALIILILYFLYVLLSKSEITFTNMLNYFLLFVSLYSIANTYSLIMNKYKLANFIVLISLALLCLLFGHISRDLILKLSDILLKANNQFSYLILINIAITIILNIFNSFMYNKSIEY